MSIPTGPPSGEPTGLAAVSRCRIVAFALIVAFAAASCGDSCPAALDDYDAAEADRDQACGTADPWLDDDEQRAADVDPQRCADARREWRLADMRLNRVCIFGGLP